MDMREFDIDSRATAPIRAGFAPQHALLAPLLAGALLGCANTSANQTQPPIDLGMTSNVPAYYNDGQTQIYQVQLPVALPVRAPTTAEAASLAAASPPYPTTPFLLASDESLEVHFTLSNLDNQPNTVYLMLDAWNEFARWRPGLLVTEDGAEPNWSTYQVPYLLPAQGRIDGTLTTDDMHELAVKIDTIENILASPVDPNWDQGTLVNRAANWQNRIGDGDPVVGKYVPGVLAGLTGFDLGLRTDGGQGGGSGPANVAVEITIDITDNNGNRFIPAGTVGQALPMPATVLSPPGARF
jgi:hypothetical protein